MTTVGTDVEAFLDHVEHRRDDAALSLVLDRVAGATSVSGVLDHLLGPVQRAAGERWEQGTYEPWQEHAVTAVVEDALGALSLHARRTPVTQHHLTLVCPAGEWHTTPARMAALALRDAGWHVDFLGGSIHADQVHRALTQGGSSMLLVSATTPLSLPGVPPLLEAARDVEVPVLVGGHAFGTSPRRARALGAEGWAPTASSGAALLASWLDDPPMARIPAISAAACVARQQFHRDRPELLRAARAQLRPSRQVPAGAERDAPTQRALQDVLAYLDVALLVDDETVLRDHVVRLALLPELRGLPAGAAAAVLDAVRTAVADRLPLAATMLDRAAADVGSSSADVTR